MNYNLRQQNLSKTDLVKSCYKSCCQKEYNFNTEFNSSDSVDNLLADI